MNKEFLQVVADAARTAPGKAGDAQIDAYWRTMNRNLNMGGVWTIPDGYTVPGTIDEKVEFARRYGFALVAMELPDTQETRDYLEAKRVHATANGWSTSHVGPLVLTKVAEIDS